MTEILIGLAAGLAVMIAVLLGYMRGLKDGAGRRGAGRRGTAYTGSNGAAQEQDALMKKYEAILDYDPYGERV